MDIENIRIKNLLELLAALIIWAVMLHCAIARLDRPLIAGAVLLGVMLLAGVLVFYEWSYRLLIPIMAAAVFTVLNYMFVQEYGAISLLSMNITFMSVALFLFLEENLNIPFWGINCLLMAAMVMFYWLRSPDGYILFYHTSRNYISVYLLIFMFIYCLALEKADRDFPFWIVLGYLLCCISGLGRGGILVGCLAAFLFFINKFYLNREVSYKVRQFYSILGIVIFLLCFLVFLWKRDMIIETVFSRFLENNNMSNNLRRVYIMKYLTIKNSIPALLLGKNTYNLTMDLKLVGGNLHNSYFMTHAYTGLGGVVLVFFSAIAGVVKLIKNRHMDLAIIVTLFFFRAMTDYLFPDHLGDIIVWFCFFLAFGKEDFKCAVKERPQPVCDVIKRENNPKIPQYEGE